MGKVNWTTVAVTVLVLAAANRVPAVRDAISGDTKFLGIF